MKEVTKPKTDVGVIIGRFHTPYLHAAHKDLIQSVSERHARVFVFLGVAPIKNTLENPLDFKHRKAMIEESFPNVEVYHIDDKREDDAWSRNVDKELRKWLNPAQTATIYGGRDSFIPYYSGDFPICELEAEIVISASAIRKQVINNYPSSEQFRAGLIAATGLHYPTAYQTVDIAIIDSTNQKMLLAQKAGEKKWRFVGGFSDPNSNSLEDDARREVMEETGLEVANIQYIGSTKIKDWRYRSGPDCIKTAFFRAEYVFGGAKAQDDIADVNWFDIDSVTEDMIIDEHKVLLAMFKQTIYTYATVRHEGNKY